MVVCLQIATQSDNNHMCLGILPNTLCYGNQKNEMTVKGKAEATAKRPKGV